MKLNCELKRFIQAFCYGQMFFAIVGSGLFLVQAMQAQQNKQTVKTEQLKALEIVTLLETTPDWSDLRGDNLLAHNKKFILDNLGRISKYDIVTIRDAVLFYLDKKQPDDEFTIAKMSRLFLLNRYIFNVPEAMPHGSSPAFGSWAGVPGDRETINRLWPFSIDKDGQFIIVGEFGGYFGQDYRAIEEFDYFHSRFGLRFLKH